MLRRDAIVTSAAILSLALAIGACTAAFSLIDALILRPLRVHEPERLVALSFQSGDPAVFGRAFTFGERRMEIIGVAEPGFTGTNPRRLTDMWVPTMMWQADALTDVRPLETWSMALPVAALLVAALLVAALLVAALLAAVPPARRAVRVDPVVALRHE